MPYDPVCGKKLGKTEYSHEYHGKTYYFCSEDCLYEFIGNPGKYVKENTDESSC